MPQQPWVGGVDPNQYAMPMHSNSNPLIPSLQPQPQTALSYNGFQYSGQSLGPSPQPIP